MKRWMMVGLLACACGSSSGNNNNNNNNGPGSITGSVAGHPLNVKDAVFAIGSSNEVTVAVTDQANTCSLLSGTTLPSTTTVLFFTLANYVPPITINPHTTGDYAWFNFNGGSPPGSAGRYWFGGFETVDTTCNGNVIAFSSAGTVSVTQVGNSSGTHLKADLHALQFGSDTLNGNVDASYCAALDTTSCGNLIARPPTPAQ